MKKTNSKNILKRNKMRSAVFCAPSTSRQDLIRRTGLCGRTVDRYAAKLERQGLITVDSADSPRGRPGTIYHSNSEKILFLSVSLVDQKLCYVVIDINSFLLYGNVLLLSGKIQPSEMIRIALDEFQTIRRRFPDMVFAAIACNCNTYKQDKSRISAFFKLPGMLRQLYDTQVVLMQNDELIFSRLCKILQLKGNIGFFCPGHLYMLVMSNGELRDDLSGFFRSFRHRQIDRTASQVCPVCGRHGCIDSQLSYEGIVRRFLKECGGNMEKDMPIHYYYNNILAHGEGGEPAACKTIRECGIFTARVLAMMKEELHLDQILLANTTRLFHDSVQTEYRKLTGDTAPLLNFNSLTATDSVYAAAELMRLDFLDF